MAKCAFILKPNDIKLFNNNERVELIDDGLCYCLCEPDDCQCISYYEFIIFDDLTSLKVEKTVKGTKIMTRLDETRDYSMDFDDDLFIIEYTFEDLEVIKIKFNNIDAYYTIKQHYI